jgi:hypothetical protein
MRTSVIYVASRSDHLAAACGFPYLAQSAITASPLAFLPRRRAPAAVQATLPQRTENLVDRLSLSIRESPIFTTHASL